MSAVTSATNTPAKAASTTTNNSSNQLPTQSLGKDAFLKLLVTQLKYQDPSKPMDDTQFISQMAQFSSLEQMTNVSTGLETLNKLQNSTQALNLAGHTVELKNPQGGDPISGKVDEVRFAGGTPSILVGGKEYTLGDVISVHGD
jgi:flagellar basal-body rod modification protein FlgD